MRAVTVLMLETLGYKVLQAASGEEAITVTKECREEIDLLMTDVVMPDMSAASWPNSYGIPIRI